MIRLHPIPAVEHDCPYCQTRLQPKGWYIPGMRNLADLQCPECNRAFYGDLLAGQALYTPLLLEQATGAVHNKYDAAWFGNWLRDSYSNRVKSPVGFSVEQFRALKKPVLLNCLDKLYGHCLLKLLNVQYYLDHGYDLIVMVPRFLHWMVPDGAAEIWTVDLPLARGTEWNDWLAAEIHRRLDTFDECWLSVAFSHPHPDDYAIERFTRVRPFPLDEWDARLATPKVTFIWREDRLWYDVQPRPLVVRGVRRALRSVGLIPDLLGEQRLRVIELARDLRAIFPTLDFAVAGLGKPGGLPAWIADLRTTRVDESVERQWCKRYAQSHVVIGVHGSNMLLPSAHAGAVVELVPEDRWGNLIQDILPNAQGAHAALLRYRFLPIETFPTAVAQATMALLHDLTHARRRFERPWNDHQSFAHSAWLNHGEHCSQLRATCHHGGNQTT